MTLEAELKYLGRYRQMTREEIDQITLFGWDIYQIREAISFWRANHAEPMPPASDKEATREKIARMQEAGDRLAEIVEVEEWREWTAGRKENIESWRKACRTQ